MTEIKDYSGLSGIPISVFAPKNTDELILFLKTNRNVKFRIGGGLSGVSGAAVPEQNEIYIDFRYFKNINWIDKFEGVFFASAGNTLQEIKDFVESEGWDFPVLPGSIKMATLGGMIACNGGGPYSLRYGKIGHFIRGIQVVKVDGTKLKLGSQCKKLSEGPDFTKLFIGSEGTLGFISEAILSCVHIPQIDLYRISHNSFSLLTEHITDFLQCNPLYLEMADADALRFSSKVNESVIWLGVTKGTKIKSQKIANLKVEMQENSKISERFEIGLNLQFYKKFIDLDISFPVQNTTFLLAELKLFLTNLNLESAFFGHAGDGNWHIHVFYEKSNELKEEFFNEFDKILFKYLGHISGEHGIGKIHKKRFAKFMDTNNKDLYAVVKSHFDPKQQLPSLFE